MEKLETIAMLVMESVGEPMKVTNLERVKENGLFYLRFNTILQSLNTLNRNQRIYTNGCIEPALQAPHIQELMAKNTWFGEAGHPMSEQTARILTIDPKLISHKITQTNVRGDIVNGTIETLDDDSYGSQMTKLILQGMEPAFSLRAMASLMKRKDGVSVANGRAHIVTYDWVVLPSHREAYRDTSSPIKQVTKNIMDAGNCVTESAIALTESAIRDFISLESVNVNLISNFYEVAKESMQLTQDMNHVILKENSNTYMVKIEDKIKHEVRNFMSSF